jgi:death-on-curing protein
MKSCPGTLRRSSGSASDLPGAPGTPARRRARPRAGGRGPRLWAARGRPRPPQAAALGKDAYPSLDAKAAALLHSLARNHALIDGDKQLGLAAVIAFCGLNGRRLTLTNDQAYDLVMKVAAGELDQVEEISVILQGATAPRH